MNYVLPGVMMYACAIYLAADTLGIYATLQPWLVVGYATVPALAAGLMWLRTTVRVADDELEAVWRWGAVSAVIYAVAAALDVFGDSVSDVSDAFYVMSNFALLGVLIAYLRAVHVRRRWIPGAIIICAAMTFVDMLVNLELSWFDTICLSVYATADTACLIITLLTIVGGYVVVDRRVGLLLGGFAAWIVNDQLEIIFNAGITTLDELMTVINGGMFLISAFAYIPMAIAARSPVTRLIFPEVTPEMRQVRRWIPLGIIIALAATLIIDLTPWRLITCILVSSITIHDVIVQSTND